MRLICPNCGAQYEVADDVIPNAGRDVQCSNCGHTWFEYPGASEAAEEGIDLPPQRDAEAKHDPVVDPEPEEEPQSADAAPVHEEPAPQETHTETQAPRPERRAIDPAVAGILREEADREEAARAAEARPDLETQPDLGIDDAPSAQDQRDDESRHRMARLRGRSGAIAASSAASSAAASRRELLPDIEEINSSLRSSTEREGSGHQAEAVAVSGRQRKRGFRFGFWLIVLIAAALTAVYVFEPRISAAVPQIKEPLASFVVMVDNARLWLDLKMQDILTWIESTSEG